MLIPQTSLASAKTFAILVALRCVIATTGCGYDLAEVEGRVTYEGQPIAKGAISLMPADGNGPSIGAVIENGKYRISQVQPGVKIIHIEAVKVVPFARSSQEMQAMHEANKARGNNSGLIDPADIVPRNAIGNGAQHEIVPGHQTLDLDLKRPGS